MTTEQLQTMMQFIIDFMTCAKFVHMVGMGEVAQEAAKYLIGENLTPENFAEEIKKMNRGKEIPKDDLFFTNLKLAFEKIQGEKNDVTTGQDITSEDNTN